MINNVSKKGFDIIDRIIDFIKKNKSIIIIFLFIFMLIYFVSDVITLYFDDYGNGSLSYAYTVDNVKGTDFTVSQLFEWASQIYNNWGGRILYAIIFIIPLIRHGIGLYMLAQSFVITGIIFFMYKIVSFYLKNKKYKEIIPIILFALYALIDMAYLRHGIYWASASVLYIWPLLPLFFLLYVYIVVCNKIENNEKNVKIKIITTLLCLLSFFATFSQEQIGVGLIAFQIFYIILHHLKNIKKYIKVDLPLFIITLVSYLVLFLAPGNWKRMDSNVEFSKLSVFGKIAKNYPELIKNIFVDRMYIFIYFLCLLFMFVIYKIIKKYKSNKKSLLLLIPFISTIVLIFQIHTFNDSSNMFLLYLNGTIWLISFFITCLIYFNINKEIHFASFLVCGFGTIICLLMSPTLGGRTYLPFIFFVILIITKLVMDVICEKNFLKYIAVLFIIYVSSKGIRNYYRIYEGYRDNYPIYKLNTKILSSYDKDSGKKDITLYKVENSWYGSTQPYEEESMEYWIKQYYDLPADVDINYIDLYEDFR